MRLVLVGEVGDFDSVFGQLGKSEQTLLKLFGLLTGPLKLLELLSIVDLIFESSFHDVLAHLFNALNEERFELVPLRAHVDLVCDLLLLLRLLFVNNHLEVPDCIGVTRL